MQTNMVSLGIKYSVASGKRRCFRYYTSTFHSLLRVLICLFVAVFTCSCSSHRTPKASLTILPAEIIGNPNIQADIATKVPLASVPKDSIASVNAMDAEDTYSIVSRVGATQAVKGKLLRLFYTKPGTFMILNFSNNYKSSASLYIPYSLFSQIPDMRAYIGRKILFTGRVVNYKGKPEVTLASSSDIKVIE